MALLSASKRIRQATFGIADYSLDTGLKCGPDEAELSYIRDQLVHCSRACGLAAPIDTVWLDLNDADGLRLYSESQPPFTLMHGKRRSNRDRSNADSLSPLIALPR
jgi:hypothetical protein